MKRLFFQASLGLLLTWTGACTSSTEILRDIQAGTVTGARVQGVPFIAQRPDTCGAAALASVLQHAGVLASEVELDKALRAQQNQGVLTIELVLEARARGLLAVQRYGVMPEELMRAIDAGLAPVILHGSPLHQALGRYHYSVLTGYDRDRQVWLAHDGSTADAIVPFERLAREHARGDRWTLLATSPSLRPRGLPGDLHLEFGLQAESRKLHDAAAHHYSQAAWLPTSPQALLNLSNIALQQDRLALARLMLELALTLEPSSAAAQNSLAWVLFKLGGDLNQAEALARKAATTGDKSVRPHALDTLATILQARGHLEDALKIRQQILIEARTPASLPAP